jgi:hypothetical protein
MPEVCQNATILLAISWQAFDRIKSDRFDLRVCDSVVAIVFSCFYMEESFNVIIDEVVKRNHDLKKPSRDSGMLKKCLWLFNELYLDNEQRLENPYKKTNNEFDLLLPLCQEFPEFRKLLQLRNDISHGEVEKIIPYLDEISHLRQSAKDIITMFLNCTELDIRNIHYQATMEELAQRYEKKGLNNFG